MAVCLNRVDVYSVIILYSNILEVFPENPKIKKAINNMTPFLAKISNITPIKLDSQVRYIKRTLFIEITLKKAMPMTHP